MYNINKLLPTFLIDEFLMTVSIYQTVTSPSENDPINLKATA